MNSKKQFNVLYGLLQLTGSLIGGVAQWLQHWSMTGEPGLRHDVQLTGDLLGGKSSAVCEPTWPTQPFILLGSINE